MENDKLKIDFCEFSKESACYIIEPSDIPNIDLYGSGNNFYGNQIKWL